MSPDTRPDPLADLLPIIDAAEAAVAAGALPVDVLNITQPVRYAIAHAGVTLTQPQPDAGLREAAQAVVDRVDAIDPSFEAQPVPEIEALRAALRPTPAAPTHPHDGYAYYGCKCVCCLNIRALATPAAPKEDDRE